MPPAWSFPGFATITMEALVRIRGAGWMMRNVVTLALLAFGEARCKS